MHPGRRFIQFSLRRTATGHRTLARQCLPVLLVATVAAGCGSSADTADNANVEDDDANNASSTADNSAGETTEAELDAESSPDTEDEVATTPTASETDGGGDQSAVLVNDFCETLTALESAYPWSEWLNQIPGEILEPSTCEDFPASGDSGLISKFELWMFHPENTYIDSQRTAGFTLDLKDVIECSAAVQAEEGDPPGGLPWCSADFLAENYGPLTSHETPSGIPYRVFGPGAAEIFVGNYKLDFRKNSGNFEFEREVVLPSDGSGISAPYVEFLERVIDSIFVPQ